MINDMGKLLNVHASDVRGVGAMVNLESKPIGPTDTPLTNRNIKYTDFNYHLRFNPSIEEDGKLTNWFVLVSDILPNAKIRFRNTQTLEEITKGKDNKYSVGLRWLLKWTNLLDTRIYRVCYWNINTCIKLSFDYAGYAEYLCSQLGLPDTNYPVFLPYKKAQQRIKDYMEYSRKADYVQDKINRGVKIHDFT